MNANEAWNNQRSFESIGGFQFHGSRASWKEPLGSGVCESNRLPLCPRVAGRFAHLPQSVITNSPTGAEHQADSTVVLCPQNERRALLPFGKATADERA